ncbi:MAG: two-component sensor histidine kinase [Gammaproteobacteria bacterium]|nr:two-component sensor histidine kinase [Gammaproteobacteria bacterium]
MHSLFLRIFVLFWIAMALIVGGSIAITFTVAAREYESPEVQRRPNVAIQASEVLGEGTLSELKAWLDAKKNSIPDRELYIIGPDGRDILGRRLSETAARRWDVFNHLAMAGAEPHVPAVAPPVNFRPPHFAPQIVASDGSTYTVLLVPRRHSIFGALSLPGISLTILCIALAVSAIASWWLAQHLSAPIRRIQEGARALASEKLDVRMGMGGMRVSAGLEGRKDELAVLARDFDAMADQLRANRAAITRLLRDISHELRSPLARMRVAVGLARQPGGDLVRQLDRLERETERLDGLISQVLKLARLHGTDTPFGREEFELDEMIGDVVRDANFEGAVKGCRVLLSGAAHATVRGNRELLRSAVENVLRNAVRYSPEGAAVEVCVARRDAGDPPVPDSPSSGLVVVIRDRGPGVPAADLERIFEPFYRVAESRDRDSGGEGIGLAITSQVMKAHGGLARAANLSAGGLEVSLSLPLAALAA